jgi:hypothetical protein
LDAHGSAAAALDAGDYYSAFLLARQEGEAELEAVALLMCGWVEKALVGLETIPFQYEATHSYINFGRWCLGDEDKASLAKERKTRLLLIAGAHTERGIPSGAPGPFEIQSLILARDQTAPGAAEIIDQSAPPDAVILLDVYGPRVPEGIFDLGVPVIFWAYDFDFHIPGQYEDLARADIILCALVGEHYALQRIYPGRVATFPAHDIYTDPARFSASPKKRNIDLVHTGISFSPMMRSKAQFLFAQAIQDDEALDIRLVQGFLETDDYRDLIGQARKIAVVDRLTGGLPTRAMDAACAGGTILSPAGVGAHELLRLAGVKIGDTDQAETADNGAAQRNLRQIFPPSPEREVRFLKFCLFQSAILSEGSRFAGSQSTPKLSIQVRTGHAHTCRAALNLIHAFIAKPMDDGIRAQLAKTIEAATGEHETSVPLNFNLARYLWAIDDKSAAIQLFDRLCRSEAKGRFDPALDDIRIHLLPVPVEMTPYEVYSGALARDLAEGEAAAPRARRVIAASAHCFVGLDHLQEGRLAAGVQSLDQALALCGDHFPAARLRARALYAAGQAPEIVLDAVYDAVRLYGPHLTELLPIATACHQALDDKAGALALVKSWCYFASRVRWLSADEHPIPPETWDAIQPYLDRLPDGLAAKIRALQQEGPESFKS